jgi:hypothetical protein
VSEPHKHWDGPGVDAWRPWQPAEVAALLAAAAVPWHVVGGWAIELFLGRPHRAHADIEIAVPRVRAAELFDRLSTYALHAIGGGESCRLAAGDLPAADKHQVWVLDPAADCWRLDVMLEPGDADTWVFRRDQRIRSPRNEIVGARDGVRYLRPEAVLLFKAKALRAKDAEDFEVCLPHLDRRARRWLRDALQRIDPDHEWIVRLGSAA